MSEILYTRNRKLHSMNNLVFSVVVLSLFLGVVGYDFIDRRLGFSYIDELISLSLFILCFVNLRLRKEFVFVICVFAFYLLYSLIFPNNTRLAIVTDFLIQIKPFIAFYAMYEIGLVCTKRQKKVISNICIVFSICFVPIAVLGFGGTGIMNYFCGLHSRFATTCIILAMTYLLFSQRRKRDYIVALFMLTLSLASLRAKSFGFYGVFLIACFFWEKKDVSNILTIKNIVMILVALALCLYLAWDKIGFYFLEGGMDVVDEKYMFARPFLYVKAIEILGDYPFLGTGLGSYATFASGKYYSPIYIKYGLIYNNQIGSGLYISDVFYPSLVQFGFTGIFLYVAFWAKRIRESFLLAKFGKSFAFFFTILVTVFFLIEGVADSTFTHNRGMFMMMLLAIALRENDNE